MPTPRNSPEKVQRKIDAKHGAGEYTLLHYTEWGGLALWQCGRCGFEFTKSPKAVAYIKIHCPHCLAERFKLLNDINETE